MKNKLFLIVGGDNRKYYELAKEVRSNGKFLKREMSNYYTDEMYLYNGFNYKITTDDENGIGCSIEWEESK